MSTPRRLRSLMVPYFHYALDLFVRLLGKDGSLSAAFAHIDGGANASATDPEDPSVHSGKSSKKRRRGAENAAAAGGDGGTAGEGRPERYSQQAECVDWVLSGLHR